MDPVKKIHKIIKSIKPDFSDMRDNIFINVIHNEFIRFNGSIEVPKIPVKELDYERADCVVWDVGDSEALLLLATLNSLAGSEDVYKKSELIRNLSREYSLKELSGKLVDNAKSIQRLLNFKAGGHQAFMKAYLNPVTFFLTDEQKHILGGQANVWTEYIDDAKHLEYMIYPRLCAMAEVLWVLDNKLPYNNFCNRLYRHVRLLGELDVNLFHKWSEIL